MTQRTSLSKQTVLFNCCNHGGLQRILADWVSPPEDLILSILEKVKDIQDFVVFGSVCKSWNEVTKNNKYSCQIPWLLMPTEANDDPGRHIYTLTKQKILPNTLHFPELSYEECIPLNYGWVLALFRKSARMILLHPISRRWIELPPFTTCSDREPRLFEYDIIAAVLSANPSELSEFVLMIVHDIMGFYMSYWKPRERGWIRIREHGTAYNDLTYYQDRFYSIDYFGKVWSFTLDNNNIPTPRLVAQTNCGFKSHVVGSQGRLLVVERDLCKYIRSIRFDVYELDLVNGSYKRITSLGDTAIFVGHNTTIAVDHASEYPNLRPNHIYFSDVDIGCYSLEYDDDVELRRLSVGDRPSFWFIPSLQPDCKFIKTSSNRHYLKISFHRIVKGRWLF